MEPQCRPLPVMHSTGRDLPWGKPGAALQQPAGHGLGCCSTQRWGSPLFPLGPAPPLASPQWMPKQQPVTPALSGREGAALQVLSRLGCCENCLDLHCQETATEQAGFNSPPSLSSSLPPHFADLPTFTLQILVFLLFLPFRRISLQPLTWASSVSPTSLLPPFPTLSPVPPDLSPPHLPFSSSCSHCTQQ